MLKNEESRRIVFEKNGYKVESRKDEKLLSGSWSLLFDIRDPNGDIVSYNLTHEQAFRFLNKYYLNANMTA